MEFRLNLYSTTPVVFLGRLLDLRNFSLRSASSPRLLSRASRPRALRTPSSAASASTSAPSTPASPTRLAPRERSRVLPWLARRTFSRASSTAAFAAVFRRFPRGRSSWPRRPRRRRFLRRSSWRAAPPSSEPSSLPSSRSSRAAFRVWPSSPVSSSSSPLVIPPLARLRRRPDHTIAFVSNRDEGRVRIFASPGGLRIEILPLARLEPAGRRLVAVAGVVLAAALFGAARLGRPGRPACEGASSPTCRSAPRRPLARRRGLDAARLHRPRGAGLRRGDASRWDRRRHDRDDRLREDARPQHPPARARVLAGDVLAASALVDLGGQAAGGPVGRPSSSRWRGRGPRKRSDSSAMALARRPEAAHGRLREASAISDPIQNSFCVVPRLPLNRDTT